MTWYVLHVKPRSEKQVMRYLEAYGYFRYLPLRQKTVRVQRRKRTTYLPLFPGYVFTRLPPGGRTRMLSTGMMVRLIEVDRPRQLIHELRQVNRALKAKPDIVPAATVFHDGDSVRVVSGPFRNLEGVVRRTVGGGRQVILNVEMIGTSVELTIAPSDLLTVNRKSGEDAQDGPESAVGSAQRHPAGEVSR